MPDRLRASLPGILSFVVIAVFIVVQLAGGNPFAVTDWLIVILGAAATLLGIAWVPPRLPAQGDGFLANLPGLFSLAVLGVFVIVTLTGGDGFGAAEMVIVILAAIATGLGLEWVPPQLPSQQRLLFLFVVAFVAVQLLVGGPVRWLT